MKSFRLTRLILPMLILGLLLPVISAATQNNIEEAPQIILKNAVWTWSDQLDGQQSIFISRYTGDDWEEPVKISSNENLNVVPSITRTAAGNLWVVWSTIGGGHSSLVYKRLVGGVWTEETSYYTGLNSNTAPSIGIDSAGKVWLAWAGFDGISDEIFYSTWDGSSFAPAIPLTSNSIPDILPVLGFNDKDNTVWIQWKQFKKSGYIVYQTIETESDWSTPAPIEETESVRKDEAQIEITLPPFITNPASASLHIPGHAVQSLPVRDMDVIQ